jgi:hypothetical protein
MWSPLPILHAIANQYRHFEQRYVPWPLLLIVSLTILAFLFGYFAP